MQKKKLAYGVMLPRELRDRFMTPGGQSMTATLPIVAINIERETDPTGVQKGTILMNPRDDEDAYAGLAFRGYLSWRTGEVELIGSQIEYSDLFSVDLSRAQRMITLLRRIRDAKAKLPVNPSDFGQYIALLAPAVGIKYMVVAENDATETRNYYPEGFYRIRPIRDAQFYVRDLIVGVMEKYLPSTKTQGGSDRVNQ